MFLLLSTIIFVTIKAIVIIIKSINNKWLQYKYCKPGNGRIIEVRLNGSSEIFVGVIDKSKKFHSMKNNKYITISNLNNYLWKYK